MKKILTIIIIASICSCNSVEPTYKITGTFLGMDQVKVNLYKLKKLKLELVDTTILSNGVFIFTGKVAVPAQYYMEIEGVNNFVKLFVENSDIQIKIDPSNPQSSEVIGSKIELQFQDFLSKNNKHHQNKINKTIDSLNNLPDDIDMYKKGELVLNPLYEKQKSFSTSICIKK